VLLPHHINNWDDVTIQEILLDFHFISTCLVVFVIEETKKEPELGEANKIRSA